MAAKECALAGRKAALLAQNIELGQEVEKLRLRLTMAQILNAVTQLVVPSTCPASNGTSSTTMIACEDIKNPSKVASSVVEASSKSQLSGEEPAKPAKTKTAKAPKAASAEEPEKVDISRLDLRIGLIRVAQKHPDADNLYVEDVDFGDTKKTVVSGLAKHVPLEQMQNRVGIFLCNLKPAKLKGTLSEAMVMCGNKDGVVEIIDPPAGCQPGDRLSVPGFPGEPDAQLNPKKNIWEQVMPDLRLNNDGVATYKSSPWIVNGRSGVCKCPTLTDAQIK